MSKRTFVLCALLAACSGVGELQAQRREIRGTIYSAATSAPLAGASVGVVGTGIGALTGPDGTYSLSAPAGPVRLRVSQLGFRSGEVEVAAAQAVADVRLEQDVLNLEGVVVTGQATAVARRNLANAVAVVSAQEVERAPAQTVDQALQGKIAGAIITANSGAPGGGIQVDLRGVSSINGDAEPLWVVDGLVVSNVAIPNGANAVTRASGPAGFNASNQDVPTNRIADINPDDIESIEVLKGASAAAIYGSKASNGVIIVTTKRGRMGAPRVSFKQQFGVSQLSNKLGSRAWTRERAVAAYGARVEPFFGSDGRPLQEYDHEEALAGRRELASETALSVSGGTETTRYYASGLYQTQPGIIDNTGYEHQSLRLNLDQKLGSRVEVGVGTSIMHSLAGRGLTNNDNTSTSFYVSLSETPNFAPLERAGDGTFPRNQFSNSNPLQTAALMRNDEDVWRVLGSANARLDLFAGESQALRFLATGGVDYFRQENDLFFPPELQFEPLDGSPGTALLGNGNNLNLNGNFNLVHTLTPAAGAFSATTSAGVQYTDTDTDLVRTVARNLNGGLDHVDAATSVLVFQNRQRVRDFGVYLQEELLLLDDRLLLTGSVRADRSSANGDTDEYFLYPKAAASYRLLGLLPFLDELKLRLAYGETGNRPQFGQKFTSLQATNNIGGAPGAGIFAATPTIGDPDIRPERQREIEGGFDAALLGGNATLSFTVYDQTITDLILSRAVAPSVGFAQEVFNGGELNTRGLELSLDATPLRSDALTWISRTSFFTTRSEIVDLPEDVPAFRPLGFGFTSSALGQFFIEEGKSATQIIGPENGELVQLGDATPDFKMGFSNELQLGRLSLYGLVDWQEGGSIINLTRLLYDANGVSEDYELPEGVTAARAVDVCHPGCSGLERISGFGTFQKQYIEDASFVKLRELTLSYLLPERLTRRAWGGVETARISLSGRNLLTFTDYSGLDPEVSNFGNQQIGRGFDVAPFPPSRTYWLSLNLGL